VLAVEEMQTVLRVRALHSIRSLRLVVVAVLDRTQTKYLAMAVLVAVLALTTRPVLGLGQPGKVMLAVRRTALASLPLVVVALAVLAVLLVGPVTMVVTEVLKRQSDGLPLPSTGLLMAAAVPRTTQSPSVREATVVTLVEPAVLTA
jgi:hypothetical protein